MELPTNRKLCEWSNKIRKESLTQMTNHSFWCFFLCLCSNSLFTLFISFVFCAYWAGKFEAIYALNHIFSMVTWYLLSPLILDWNQIFKWKIKRCRLELNILMSGIRWAPKDCPLTIAIQQKLIKGNCIFLSYLHVIAIRLISFRSLNENIYWKQSKCISLPPDIFVDRIFLCWERERARENRKMEQYNVNKDFIRLCYGVRLWNWIK